MHFDTTSELKKRQREWLIFMQSDKEGIQSAFNDIKGQCGELENLFIDWKLSVTKHWDRMTTRQIIGLSDQYKNVAGSITKDNLVEQISSFIETNVKTSLSPIDKFPQFSANPEANTKIEQQELQKLFDLLKNYNENNLKTQNNVISDKIQKLKSDFLGNNTENANTAKLK